MHDSELDIILRMSQDVLHGRDQYHCLAQVTETTLQLLGAEHASVRLCDDTEGTLFVAARAGNGIDLPASTFCVGQGVLGWVAKSAQPAVIADCEQDERFSPRCPSAFVVRSLVAVPLMCDGRVRGVLSASSPKRAAFGQRHEQLALLLAANASQIVRLEALQQLVITDAHTGAYNRHYLMPRLNEEIRRAQRSETAVSIMMLDLDGFKQVNDTYGHAAGDLVLKAFVTTLRRSIRSIDIVVRRGGDEFVIVMPATSAASARHVAERIRSRLLRERCELAEGHSVTQTASIGVATWDGQEGADSLERRADLVMYKAKRLGRNRVVSARMPKVASTDVQQLELWRAQRNDFSLLPAQHGTDDETCTLRAMTQ